MDHRCGAKILSIDTGIILPFTISLSLTPVRGRAVISDMLTRKAITLLCLILIAFFRRRILKRWIAPCKSMRGMRGVGRTQRMKNLRSPSAPWGILCRRYLQLVGYAEERKE